jgi:hypothetical protein
LVAFPNRKSRVHFCWKRSSAIYASAAKGLAVYSQYLQLGESRILGGWPIERKINLPDGLATMKKKPRPGDRGVSVDRAEA